MGSCAVVVNNITEQPPSLETSPLAFAERVASLWCQKCTSSIGKGASLTNSVLCREVICITASLQRFLVRRFHYSNLCSIETDPNYDPKKDKGASLRLGGVTIGSGNLLRREEELAALACVVPANPAVRKKYVPQHMHTHTHAHNTQ